MESENWLLQNIMRLVIVSHSAVGMEVVPETHVLLSVSLRCC